MHVMKKIFIFGIFIFLLLILYFMHALGKQERIDQLERMDNTTEVHRKVDSF